MYAHRYHRPGLQPGSLAASLAITGAMVAGIIFSAPDLITVVKHTPITTITITDPPVPPPEPPKPTPHKPVPTQRTILTAPDPEVKFTTTIAPIARDPLPSLPDPISTVPLGPPATPAADPPAPPPVLPALIGASVDPRYADALQPPYPASERRAEHEGRAVVKVLIGVDGRVKQVERVSADSDAFFEATQRQALTRWRFKPATRGGIPVESWKEMNVHFVLEDG